MNQKKNCNSINYIKQMNAYFEKIVSDPNMNPTHISLYLALFQQWNSEGFRNSISVSRSRLSYVSKIGSKTTYHKCMKELHAGGYLKYYPSKDPLRGSLVELLCLYDTVGQKTVNVVGQSLEATGLKNDVAVVSYTKPNETYTNLEEGVPVILEDKNLKKEVVAYFESHACAKNKGEVFFDYYSKRGWKTANEHPIRSWRELADKWIQKEVAARNVVDELKNLLTTKKDYNEPL